MTRILPDASRFVSGTRVRWDGSEFLGFRGTVDWELPETQEYFTW